MLFLFIYILLFHLLQETPSSFQDVKSLWSVYILRVVLILNFSQFVPQTDWDWNGGKTIGFKSFALFFCIGNMQFIFQKAKHKYEDKQLPSKLSDLKITSTEVVPLPSVIIVTLL